MRSLLPALFLGLLLSACAPPDHDVIIRNGMIIDGSGGTPYLADLAINADTIAFIGDLSQATARTDVDAAGMAVTPGFINMLSWAPNDLLEDGRSMG